MKYKYVHKVNMMKCCRGLCVTTDLQRHFSKKVTPCQAILNQLTTISGWVQLHSLQKAEITHECQPTWQIVSLPPRFPIFFVPNKKIPTRSVPSYQPSSRSSMCWLRPLKGITPTGNPSSPAFWNLGLGSFHTSQEPSPGCKRNPGWGHDGYCRIEKLSTKTISTKMAFFFWRYSGEVALYSSRFIKNISNGNILLLPFHQNIPHPLSFKPCSKRFPTSSAMPWPSGHL